jgi:hypothetical protein
MAALKLYLGEFPVIENKLGNCTVHLGKNVTITIPLQGVPNTLKPGDLLPLYTEVQDAYLIKPDSKSGN